MPKISTEWLRDQIPVWLGTEELRKKIWGYYIEEGEDISELAEEIGLKKDATADQVNQKLWDDWKDGSKWKRFDKHRLGEDWQEYFYEPGAFVDDFAGDYNKDLVTSLSTEQKAKCIHRGYGQRNPRLMDNFRLEIVTTPDDVAVVGWVVVVD